MWYDNPKITVILGIMVTLVIVAAGVFAGVMNHNRDRRNELDCDYRQGIFLKGDRQDLCVTPSNDILKVYGR